MALTTASPLGGACDTTDEDQLGIETWLQAFRTQRDLVEHGIRQGLPLEARRQALRNAKLALPEVDLNDLTGLEAVADSLERKLGEMLDVILGRATGPLADVRLPRDFEAIPNMSHLSHPTYGEERQWLFIGSAQEILYEYRDRGRAFVLNERNLRLKDLSAGVKKMAGAIEALNSHLVVEQAFDLAERQEIAQTIDTAQRIKMMYESALRSGGDDSIEAVLENNANVFKAQFTLSCAKLALRLYGHVAKAHLQDLLSLKSIYVLQVPLVGDDLSRQEDAERKYLERSMERAMTGIYKRARQGAWPVWPLLQLYKYDTRFGCTPPKKRPGVLDEGLSSAPPPETRTGGSILGF